MGKTRDRGHCYAARMSPLRTLVGTFALALAVAGCATTRVEVENEAADVGGRPPIVLVQRFGWTVGEVTENQGFVQQRIDATESTTADQRSADIAREVSERLADELVSRIRSLGLDARRARGGDDVPLNGLLITGYFVDINEGNRLKRLVIGLGAGRSQLDAKVEVRQRARRGWIRVVDFQTHADSGAMPGAAVTMGAGAAAQGAVTGGMVAANVAATGIKGYRSGIDAMAGRSADKAADMLSQIFGREGWISPDNVRTPLL
jgi:hypothetical protein